MPQSTVSTPKNPSAPRAWQRMLSGRRLDLLNPSPVDIEIEDIAHGLARVARWNGQTTGDHAFSVAQHSLLVADAAKALKPNLTPAGELAALLHDAPEYVVGDLISPFKAAVGIDYKAFEIALLQTIHIRFGLQATLPKSLSQLIKRADRVAAFYEATALAGFSNSEARKFFGVPGKVARPDMTPLPPTQISELFLNRFRKLEDGLKTETVRK